MKAMQIKYLPVTDTKPSRLKIWAKNCIALTEPLDYGMNIDEQARLLADTYRKRMGWNKVSGFGTLPNGDFVAILDY